MNKNDIYKDQLRALFDDFEADIPIDGWDKLEKSMYAKEGKAIIRRNWYIGSAAAVAALLISSLLFINKPKQVDNDIPYIAESNSSQTLDIKQSETIEKVEDINKVDNQNKTLVVNQTKIIDTSKDNNTSDYFDQVKITDNIEQPSEGYDKSSAKESEVKKDNKENQLTQDEVDKLIKELEESANIDIFSEERGNNHKNNRPLVLSINARGGLTSSQQTSNSHMTLRGASTYQHPYKDTSEDGLPSGEVSDGISGLFPKSNTADNKAEMIHSQPYSVGITVSKNILDKLSVETGLVYTYLHSKAKNTSTGYKNKEEQEVHYLGIPVNLNYNILDLGRFNLFATIGGMVEKDVYGVHRYDASSISPEQNISSERKNSDKINMENPQLSINAGVGASYAIYKAINIYAKVGGAYYFDAGNHEYRTIYSDKKILLDINAGLRFQF